MLDYDKLSKQLDETTRAFSGGTPGFQVFRLEQQEIGERMLIPPTEPNLYCLGYSDFVERMKAENVPSCFSRLLKITEQMLNKFDREIPRLVRIQNSLIDLIDLLDPKMLWVDEDERKKVGASGIAQHTPKDESNQD